MDNSNSEFDIALSYASEQGWYVEPMARALVDYEVSVFYDRFDEARLWGRDGIETFTETYGRQAFRVIMFISADYVRKGWPTVERRAALARLLRDPSSDHILPIRFDDSKVPGLATQTIYQQADSRSPIEMAELVVDHLIKAGRLPASVKQRHGEAVKRARLISFTSLAQHVSGETWKIEYRVANNSPSAIDSAVVVVPDYGRDPRASADAQSGCAVEMVVGPVGPGQIIEDTLQTDLQYEPSFGELPYTATLLWSDANGNHWAACGSELRRRLSRARTC